MGRPGDDPSVEDKKRPLPTTITMAEAGCDSDVLREFPHSVGITNTTFDRGDHSTAYLGRPYKNQSHLPDTSSAVDIVVAEVYCLSEECSLEMDR